MIYSALHCALCDAPVCKFPSAVCFLRWPIGFLHITFTEHFVSRESDLLVRANNTTPVTACQACVPRQGIPLLVFYIFPSGIALSYRQVPDLL